MNHHHHQLFPPVTDDAVTFDDEFDDKKDDALVVVVVVEVVVQHLDLVVEVEPNEKRALEHDLCAENVAVGDFVWANHLVAMVVAWIQVQDRHTNQKHLAVMARESGRKNTKNLVNFDKENLEKGTHLRF